MMECLYQIPIPSLLRLLNSSQTFFAIVFDGVGVDESGSIESGGCGVPIHCCGDESNSTLFTFGVNTNGYSALQSS